MYVQCMPGSMGAPGRVVVIWTTFGGQHLAPSPAAAVQSIPSCALSGSAVCYPIHAAVCCIYVCVLCACLPAFCMCGCVSVWRRALTHTRSLDSAYAIANVCLCACVCVCVQVLLVFAASAAERSSKK